MITKIKIFTAVRAIVIPLMFSLTVIQSYAQSHIDADGKVTNITERGMNVLQQIPCRKSQARQVTDKVNWYDSIVISTERSGYTMKNNGWLLDSRLWNY